MSTISLFPTTVYKNQISRQKKRSLNSQLLLEIESLANDDLAGIKWSAEHYKNGFTSYASANKMHQFSPTFAELEKLIRGHVVKYIKQLRLNIKPAELQMSTCWVNIMGPYCAHSMHIHPQSIISGTYYLQMPKNCSALRFEDPRYTQFMSRPPLQINAPANQQVQFTLPAQSGDLILFESWIKHEVPMNTTQDPRISISFNY